MAKVTCDVIQDLLPLYVEDCASEDTCLLIEEHLKHCPYCSIELEKLREPLVLPMDTEKVLMDKIRSKQRKNKILTVLITIIAAVILAGTVLVSSNYRANTGEVLEEFSKNFDIGIKEASLKTYYKGREEYYTANTDTIDRILTILKSVDYKKVEVKEEYEPDYKLGFASEGERITLTIDGTLIRMNDIYYEIDRLIGESILECFKEDAVAYLPDPELTVKSINKEEYLNAYEVTMGNKTTLSDDADYEFFEVTLDDSFFSEEYPVDERFFLAVHSEKQEPAVHETFRILNEENTYSVGNETLNFSCQDGAIYGEWDSGQIVLYGRHGASNAKENLRGDSFWYHIGFVFNPDTLVITETQISTE